jgi:hypothetical protein
MAAVLEQKASLIDRKTSMSSTSAVVIPGNVLCRGATPFKAGTSESYGDGWTLSPGKGFAVITMGTLHVALAEG